MQTNKQKCGSKQITEGAPICSMRTKTKSQNIAFFDLSWNYACTSNDSKFCCSVHVCK